jgi:hypothetical protein
LKRNIVRVGEVALLVLVLGVGYFSCKAAFDGPVPSMSLVPALPDDAKIVQNETEWTDGAGGSGARILVLRSDTRSPDQLAADVVVAFDGDRAWRGDSSASTRLFRTWRMPAASCDGKSPSTTASVSIADAGTEIPVGQFNTFVLDARSVVIEIRTLDHVFCNVGSALR